MHVTADFSVVSDEDVIRCFRVTAHQGVFLDARLLHRARQAGDPAFAGMREIMFALDIAASLAFLYIAEIPQGDNPVKLDALRRIDEISEIQPVFRQALTRSAG